VKITLKYGVALALALAGSTAASAATITFNALTTSNFYNPANPTTIDGFNFAGAGGNPDALGVWGSNLPFNADQGGATLFSNFRALLVTVTKVGGGTFDLNSIDLADVYNNGTGGSVDFSFTTGSGTTAQSVALDGLVGLQTFTFNKAGLTSFSYLPTSTQGRWVQIDNVVVNQLTGGVPEPTAWALMLTGFGLVGAAMRRRRETVSVSFA
jgi:hypothetical protein